MSTHNICFYKELEKIIPEFSTITKSSSLAAQLSIYLSRYIWTLRVSWATNGLYLFVSESYVVCFVHLCVSDIYLQCPYIL